MPPISKLPDWALILSFVITAACSSSGASPVPTPAVPFAGALERAAIVRVMTAAADWQLANPSRHPRHDWTQAPFWIGLTSLAPLSSDPQRYLSAVRRNGEENRWRPGPRPLHADDHAITQSYFLLQRVEKDPAIIAPARQNFDAVILYPFDESLEFVDFAKTSRAWVWCDALFMSPPALAMAAKATGNRRYLDFMNRMWWKTTDYLYDKEEHLYYRDSRFFEQRARNGRKIFWSRGNGWVLAGLARVLQEMPTDYGDRPRYLTLFREMAAAIARVQQSDGYWRTSLLDPDAHPLPETSGSAFYVYALAWGINEHLLDHATYEPIVRRGWAALVRAVHPNGMLGYVQRIGDQPGDTSPSGTEIYGVGGLLLAGSEVHRLAPSPTTTR
jgi:unsaturated rhamnogalacturonyl hydrolase